MTMSTKILVVGATGLQGGSVVTHLLSGEYGEFKVCGLVQPTTLGTDRARALTEGRGVRVIRGDLLERSTLDWAVEGRDGVFIMVNTGTLGPERAIEAGKNITDAAAEAEVSHIVVNTAAGADDDVNEEFDAVYEIEQYVRNLDVPWTVIRPVDFMQNLEWQREEISNGTLAMPLAEGVSLQMLDARDIGKVAAATFANPEQYAGEVIELAGDERTLEGIAASLSEVLGHEVEAVHVPIEAVRGEMPDELVAMYEWFNETGYDIDISALRERTGIEFATLDDYLESE